MPPIFLLIVKIAFLIVLYLFVARAVGAVLLDVYGPRADRPRRAAPPAQQAAGAHPPGPHLAQDATRADGQRPGRQAHGPTTRFGHDRPGGVLRLNGLGQLCVQCACAYFRQGRHVLA